MAWQFFIHRKESLHLELTSGVITGIVMIPEIFLLAYLSGLPPSSGFITAVLVTGINAVAGGRPGMVSTSSFSMALIMVQIVANYGYDHLALSIALMGIWQLLLGFNKLGKFIRLVPRTVMLGFVSGMAVLLLILQLKFLYLEEGGERSWLSGPSVGWTAFFIFLTLAIMNFFPLITKKIPSAIVAIIVIWGITWFFDLPMMRLEDKLTEFGEDGILEFPIYFQFPYKLLSDTSALMVIIPSSLLLALAGSIESLMAMNIMDDLHENRGNGNRVCVAQGIANIACSLFGGMAGCASIGMSVLNFRSGGKNRLSALTASLTIFVMVLLVPGLIAHLPLALTTGVMVMVAIGMVSWSSFKNIRKMPTSDAIVLIGVAGATILFDATYLAVLSGIVFAALAFAYENAVRVRIRKGIDKRGRKYYNVSGLLFYGSAEHFIKQFNPEEDPDDVIINFYESRVADQSGIDAINSVSKKYIKAEKKLSLKYLSRDSRRLLKKAGNLMNVSLVENQDDPRYNVVTDKTEEI